MNVNHGKLETNESPGLIPAVSFELRSDVQALRFGEFVTWAKLVVRVSVGPEGKFSLGYFHPCGFHLRMALITSLWFFPQSFAISSENRRKVGPVPCAPEGWWLKAASQNLKSQISVTKFEIFGRNWTFTIYIIYILYI